MQELIKAELRLWAIKTLSPPNAHFNALPACPFAAQAFAKDRVSVRMGFGWQMGNLEATAAHFPRNKDVVIHAELNPSMSRSRFHQEVSRLNEKHSKQNIWFIGFHPDDPEADFVDDEDGFENLVDDPYAMVFVQRLTELDDASKALEAQRYYTKVDVTLQAALIRRRKAREEYENGIRTSRRKSRQRQSESIQTSNGGQSEEPQS